MLFVHFPEDWTHDSLFCKTPPNHITLFTCNKSVDIVEPKKHSSDDNKIILKDPVISGVNAPTQKKCVTIDTTEVPVVLESASSNSMCFFVVVCVWFCPFIFF